LLDLHERKLVSDVAVFVLERDVKLQPTNQCERKQTILCRKRSGRTPIASQLRDWLVERLRNDLDLNSINQSVRAYTKLPKLDLTTDAE